MQLIEDINILSYILDPYPTGVLWVLAFLQMYAQRRDVVIALTRR